MKFLSISLALLLTLINPSLANAQPTAPGFSLPGDSGQVTLSDYQGKVVYLDFWASWCPPCRASFPWMNDLQKKYGKQGLEIIAVNLDKDRSSIKEFIAATQPQFTVAYDPEGTLAERYEVMGMPSSYLIDRNGKLHSTHIGFRDKDKAKLEQQIIQLLEGK